jgi:hypothetical protein
VNPPSDLLVKLCAEQSCNISHKQLTDVKEILEKLVTTRLEWML